MRLAGLSYPAALDLLRLLSKACVPAVSTVSLWPHQQILSMIELEKSLISSAVFLMMTGMGFVEEEGRAVFLHLTSCPG